MAKDFDELVRDLEDAIWEVRQDAAKFLGELGDVRAVEPLIAALGDKSSDVRKAAAWGLGELGDVRAVEPLTAALEDRDVSMRGLAAEALGKFDDAHAIEALKGLPRILVTDDEGDVRELIAWSLRYGGFEVDEAANGIEAVEKARKHRPDLIIMDVRMPKKTGYEACQELKEANETKDITIVFLSSKAQEAELKEGLQLGAAGYILKPFEAEQLPKRIAEILHGTRLGIYEGD